MAIEHMHADYRAFLAGKFRFSQAHGFEVPADAVHPICKPHQRDTIRWAVRKGRAALFLRFGLGKTIIQLETLRLIYAREGGRALIIAPLGVRQEFAADAALLGFTGALVPRFVRRSAEVDVSGLYITNYESVRDGRLDPTLFSAVTLDEAAVLRSYGSKTYQTFLALFDSIPFRFVATATPSPNRYKELIHYAGFLGVMDTGQALAQPLASNVLTPNGWRRMGDIRVGDRVIGRNGQATEVLGVYPQGRKPIYRVAFSDGSSARCTGEHVWLTRTQYERNAAAKFSRRNPDADASRYWTVKETAEIADSLLCASTGAKNHEVPLVDPVAFDPQPVTVDPYLLGLLIGDGHLRDTSVSLTTADPWIVGHVSAILAPLGLAVRKNRHVRRDRQPNYDYIISAGDAGRVGRGHRSNAVLNGLRFYGLLGKRAWEKRIPSAYLVNSVDVRLAVLQGLMDADGTISRDSRNRTTRLCTTSRGLADDVVCLTQSLGGTAEVRQRRGRTPRGEMGRMQYLVTLRLPNGINPFRLPRKADLVVAREKYLPKRYIVSVTPEGVEEAQCIAVADPEHLYVTDKFVVTHNTRFFQRDSEQANHLTLYPHMEREFFLWLHSWALFVQTPGDMGYSDEGYALPPLLLDFVEVPSRSPLGTFDRWGESRLIADSAQNLAEAAEEKRESIASRLAQLRVVLAEWAASDEPDAPFIVWCDLNAEQDAVEALLDELGISYASIHGSLDTEEAERRLLAFKAGERQAMIGKPVMLGAGPNLQHCHRAVFLGITYKFNDFLQAIHRLHRFLQPSPVDIRAIHTEAERGVRKTLDAKWAEDEVLRARMSDVIRTYGLSTTGFEQALARTIGCARQVVRGAAYEVVNHDSVEEYRAIEADRFGLIVTSIPFGNHYEYSASYNDFGHNPDHAAFFRQMDYLTPELLRTLKPGRIAAIHVKDRIRFGNVTGDGFPTVEPFHADCIAHYRRHGFRYIGMITVVTDVVRENNQTYRLGWTEQCKDGTKMGVGSPEYVLLFRKLPSDTSKGYADEPVVKSKAAYTRARWQLDAHAFWRASGNRLLTPDELAGYGPEVLAKLYAAHSAATVYDHADHVRIGEALEARGALPATFMCLAPASHDPAVWTDVARMRTLNGAQTARGLTNHICPLQFDIVDRLIGRYSNPGDEVTDPFAGLGTVPLRAVELGRRGHGCELNPAYFADSLGYLRAAEAKASVVSLFDLERLADDGAAGDASQVAA